MQLAGFVAPQQVNPTVASNRGRSQDWPPVREFRVVLAFEDLLHGIVGIEGVTPIDFLRAVFGRTAGA